jgi:hypothetical protein
LSLVELAESEGPQPCFALLFLLQEGKLNKVGRKEFMGSIRHKDPLLCSHGALAQYLFERFHVSGEEVPSFRRRKDWYNTKVLVTSATSAKVMANRTEVKRKSKGEDTKAGKPGGGSYKYKETELAYIAQGQEIWRIFEAAGVASIEITHAMRGYGARAAGIHGVRNSQVGLLYI